MTRLRTQWVAGGLRDARSASRARGLGTAAIVLLLVMLAIGLAMLAAGSGVRAG